VSVVVSLFVPPPLLLLLLRQAIFSRPLDDEEYDDA